VVKLAGDKNAIPDHSVAADDNDYEVRFLIEWYGISEAQARDVIARVGNDQEKLDEAAEKLTA
jgi:hypothetical protein